MSDDLLARAFAAIDAANSADPNLETVAGVPQPKELVYGQRMSAWLERLRPDASEALRLACRAQHIRRWHIPRDTFPLTREGYLQWRKHLYAFHAETAAAILREAGYDAETVARVAFLVSKRQIKADPDAQAVEDAACLVFLENHFAEFAKAKNEEKLIDILRKTWKKMSPRAQEMALKLELPPGVADLVKRALA